MKNPLSIIALVRRIREPHDFRISYLPLICLLSYEVGQRKLRAIKVGDRTLITHDFLSELFAQSAVQR